MCRGGLIFSQSVIRSRWARVMACACTKFFSRLTLRVTLRGNAEVQPPPWLITGSGLFFSIATVRPVDFPRLPTGLSGAMLVRTGDLTESRQFLHDLMMGGDVQRVLLLEVRQLVEVL